ncbi:MAG: SpoIVB peptidase [Anaerostipes sp.]|nr:SpoIVB peptidase [Anaerostipes sp.]
MKKYIYRRILCGLLFMNCIVLSLLFIRYCEKKLPSSIQLTVGQKGKFQYDIPVIGEIEHQKINLNKPFTISKNSVGKYQINTKLFGAIPLKKINVNVVKETKVILSGKLIGVYVETNGILVLDTDTVTGIDQVNHKPAEGKIRKNDYILKVNDKEINTKAELIQKINDSEGKSINLKIKRNNENLTVRVTPVKSYKDGQYKLGIWVRDNTQGIGTLTFTSGKQFGGLGHGIYDIDTGNKMQIKGGYLITPSIDTIKKGKNGSPGEIVGSIYYKEAEFIGVISKNTNYGIFGQLQKKESQKSYPIGYKQDVKKGKAQIVSYISGKRKVYQIQITNIDQSNHDVLKGIEVKIVDPELLKLTNGIVQGMSGSPILQNGKFIGAITHVFVNDPTRGYGVFAETMLEKNQ